MTEQRTVHQLRVVVEAEDYDEAVAFYRDLLGMPELAAFAEGGEDRVAILDAGRATLELASPAHRQAIDRVEARGRRSPADPDRARGRRHGRADPPTGRGGGPGWSPSRS